MSFRLIGRGSARDVIVSKLVTGVGVSIPIFVDVETRPIGIKYQDLSKPHKRSRFHAGALARGYWYVKFQFIRLPCKDATMMRLYTHLYKHHFIFQNLLGYYYSTDV
jgi:hypothetical protein